ncbi:MAG: hypothetical protein ISF22_07615 [Methanomassiliicoccus sp.]|nr:hypothetical protein [Methanomassiliicoccus sp.]
MTTSSPPIEPKKGMSKMLIAVIVIAIVAVAAVAGAYVLMNNLGSTGGNNEGNDNGDNNGNDNQNGGNTVDFNLKTGDFMTFKTTTDASGISLNSTIRWEVTSVTNDGYDIRIDFVSDMFNYSTTVHSNKTDDIGSGAVQGNYSQGSLVGTETLSTSFGTKQVEHWKETKVTGSTTEVTDYYVGKDTKMVYKVVATSTDTQDPTQDSEYTMVIDDTNISAIRDGDKT